MDKYIWLLFKVIVLSAVMITGVVTFYGVYSFKYNSNCRTPLFNATMATDITIAIEDMEMAIAYLEQSNTIKGNTNIIEFDMSNDIKAWYDGLKYQLDDLKSASKKDKIDQYIALFNLRKLNYLNSGSLSIKQPSYIEMYPYHKLFVISFFLSLSAFLLAAVSMIVLIIVDITRK